MRFIISADDYGLTKGITDSILDCFDNGILSSVSIIANGYSFDYAINEYKKRPSLRLGVHLNFFEGKPILPREKVNMLVNENGKFYHSFPSLWLTYLLGKQKDRVLLKQQIKLEMSAQINKVKESIGKDSNINIDSHLYFHFIPFVFDAILELREEFNVSYIRMCEEPSFFCNGWIKSIKNYCSPNIIKHILLKTLSKKYKTTLSDRQLQYCDYFVGILFSGNMSEPVVRAALRSIPRINDDITVEILFHPYMAMKEEAIIWEERKDLIEYYCSPQRQCERETIKSSSFKDLSKI